MADSVRQQIFDALITRLQTISVANNYETALGANVHERRTTPWQESELPGLDVREGDEDIAIGGEFHVFTLAIEIEIMVTGTASQADVRKATADVTQAVGKPPLPASDVKFSSLIKRVEPVSTAKPDFEQKDSKFGSILTAFNIIYRTLAFDPYSAA